ncbi:MAG: hypothetical protein ND866_00100, partial [Pyrinomonadaceae bacterium]|nr:hypothetical protein [Pyrinomonadaceae bacterium]
MRNQNRDQMMGYLQRYSSRAAILLLLILVTTALVQAGYGTRFSRHFIGGVQVPPVVVADSVEPTFSSQRHIRNNVRPEAATSTNAFMIEAESGVLSLPMTLASDVKAFGNLYATSNVKDSGSITFTINIEESGDYMIWGRVLGSTPGQGSFSVSVDEGDEDVYDLAKGPWSKDWQWKRFNASAGEEPLALNPRSFNLSQGEHRIVFRGREAYVGLDCLVISKDPNFVPTDPVPVPNSTLTLKPTSPSTPVLTLAPSGLVAAWGFSEGSGTSVSDASGNGHTGTISGATWSTQGKFGRSLSFDGVNDWATINSTALLNLTTAMTLEAWVFPTTTSGVRDILIKEGASHDFYNLYARNAGGFPESNVFVGGANRTSEGAVLAVNTWTHLAGTYDGTTLRLFI